MFSAPVISEDRTNWYTALYAGRKAGTSKNSGLFANGIEQESRLQGSALIREELEDVVAGMSPAARAVFDDIKRRNGDDRTTFEQDFDALTPIERNSAAKAAELLNELAEAETTEDHKRSKRVSRPRRRLWTVSVLVSLACVIAMGAILMSVRTAPTTPDPADTVVTTADEVTRYLDAQIPAPVRGAESPVFIPTGLYIESVEFSGPYTLEVSGQIWQRYANNLPKDISKGVFLPDAKEQPTLKEVSRKQLGNEELIGWTFHATVREQFDYTKYPMGRHQIKLRMRHPEYTSNVYLTPDLASYVSVDPSAVRGMDPGLVLENWDVQQAFFSYRTHRYHTDFGNSGFVTDRLYPELYYSIAVKRHLVSPFISRAIVPIVILVLLFAVVNLLSRNNERLEKFGVRPGTVVFTGSALFFAVIVGHNALRDEVQAPGFIYIESLYIMTYFVILAVALNSVLLVARPNLRLFRDYDNLWARVLYWPLIWAVLLLVTFLTFCR
jgi:hypothetical protein